MADEPEDGQSEEEQPEQAAAPAGPPLERTSKADAAMAARALVRSRRSAALATALSTDDGRPYASLVTYACDCDGSPILLLSQLSDHTRNLVAEPRTALLIEDASRRANPQAGPRLTLLGRLTVDAEPRLRRRFLARQPGAGLYAGFTDFAIYRMSIERAHWVGGFAGARWLEGAHLFSDAAAAAAIAVAEPELLDHANNACAGTIDLCAARVGRRGTGWRMIALDPEGCDLARSGSFARLPFSRPAVDAAALREMLSALAQGTNAGAANAAGDADSAP